MEASFDLTEEDITALSVHHLTRSPEGRSTRKNMLLGGIAFLAAGITSIATTNGYDETKPAGPGVISGAAFGGACLFAGAIFLWTRPRPRMVRSRVRKAIAAGGFLGSIGPKTVRIDTRRLTEEAADERSETAWRLIPRIELGPDHIFLYRHVAQQASNAMIIPLRAFGTTADRDEFVLLAQRYWQEARSKETS